MSFFFFLLFLFTLSFSIESLVLCFYTTMVQLRKQFDMMIYLPVRTGQVKLIIVSSRYVVATTTIWSGASYIYSKDAVKILPHNTAPTTSSEQKQEQEGERQREEKKPEEKK